MRGIGAGICYYFSEGKKITEITISQDQAFLDFSEEVKYGQEISYDDLLSKLIDKNKLHANTNITLLINETQLNQKETFKFEHLGTYTVNVKINILIH